MTDDTDPERWARLRFSVIGHLLAAPPERGELRAALLELASRTWSHPNDGTAVRFGFSTIERWYHKARRAADPVAVLRRQRREDAGVARRLSPAMAREIDALYRQHGGWSIQLHHDNLSALADEQKGLGAPRSPSRRASIATPSRAPRNRRACNASFERRCASSAPRAT